MQIEENQGIHGMSPWHALRYGRDDRKSAVICKILEEKLFVRFLGFARNDRLTLVAVGDHGSADHLVVEEDRDDDFGFGVKILKVNHVTVDLIDKRAL